LLVADCEGRLMIELMKVHSNSPETHDSFLDPSWFGRTV
jgi:hypothetical protein